MRDDGYSDVPDGKIAAVVTHLEMRSPPLSPKPIAHNGVAIRHVRKPDVDWYRDLYARVGADWLWAFRLGLSRDALATRIQDDKVALYALERPDAGGHLEANAKRPDAGGHVEAKASRAQTAVGFAELDFRVDGECELALFGLTAPEVGRGLGRHLMNHAIAQAWAQPITRFWLHTCTLDHPGALQFYIRSGFTPVRRQIEVTDDPRLTGVLPLSAAPHVPIIRPRG